jgi:hypothetical protein
MGTDGMSVKEFAEGVGMTINGVYLALKREEIPHIKIGGKIIIQRSWYQKNIQGETLARSDGKAGK